MEYPVKFDAAFCFPCLNFESKAERDFRGMRYESTFTTAGYRNWKHAVEINRGFSKHAVSKEHLACYSTCKERIEQSEMGKEITSLGNTEAIERNRYYFSTLIDMVTFLVSHQLALRGKIDAFESKDEGGNGLCLSLFTLITLLKKTKV